MTPFFVVFLRESGQENASSAAAAFRVAVASSQQSAALFRENFGCVLLLGESERCCVAFRMIKSNLIYKLALLNLEKSVRILKLKNKILCVSKQDRNTYLI